MIVHPSDNYGDRPDGVPPSLVVLHYTGMMSAAAALDRLTDTASQVSAHYLIDVDGTLYGLVDPAKRAWHAGVSHWQGVDNVNDHSIGIELVNPGHEFGYQPFPEAQMDRLIDLLQDLGETYAIQPHAYVGHSDVAPERKYDPGEFFNWERLAAAGFGLVSRVTTKSSKLVAIPGSSGDRVRSAQQRLTEIGYRLTISGEFDRATLNAVTAFQRHWRRRAVNGLLDQGTCDALDDLAAQMLWWKD